MTQKIKWRVRGVGTGYIITATAGEGNCIANVALKVSLATVEAIDRAGTSSVAFYQLHARINKVQRAVENYIHLFENARVDLGEI